MRAGEEGIKKLNLFIEFRIVSRHGVAETKHMEDEE
jgi:hypothetical protein